MKYLKGSIAAFEIKKMIFFLMICATIYLFIIKSKEEILSFNQLKNLIIKASQTVNINNIYSSYTIT